ncbi:MAG: amino-acid N-acetyltransferase [Treponema sp.]|nr:amino-acid N-acetyltransferase [Treponema sp.]
MQENPRNIKAQHIRDVIRYIQHFKDATLVIYLDDEVIDSPLFSSHIRDIAIIHQAGIKVCIVPGARKRIDEILSSSNISWEYKDGVRITEEKAMPQIKMAAFDISNIVMTSLAAHQITATIGNWVRARSKGVLEGTDYGTAGEIDRLQTEAIRNTLDNGFIPIFPCIGWNSNGKPYNISSVSLAKEIAINLKAEKLFFVLKNAEINCRNFVIPEQIGLSEFGDIPALNLQELELFLKVNKDCSDKKIISLLNASSEACKKGVERSHILNGSIEGALPCEIFSDLGSGTMVYSSDYGNLRPMELTDIPAVLSVMNPFIAKKILLPRTEQVLSENMADYIVYEIDGGIRACASLHVYDQTQAEIAGIAVDSAFSNLGIGPKLVEYLIARAKKQNLKSVFILTTQTSDWFEHLGFTPDSIESLPQERRSIWTPQRNSKVYRMNLK